MKIFIVEDDYNIIKIIKQIISDKELGQVIGYSLDSNSAKEDILILKPDIVLIDLLMSEKDGITLMKEIKEEDPDIQFIMISQVSEKEMISKAYQNGAEYYISKPINAIEIKNIINRVKQHIKERKIINKINNLMAKNQLNNNSNQKRNHQKDIKKIMQEIGILGEAGSKDILKITSYLIENNKRMADFTIKEICSKFNDNYKAVEQRIRRTAISGLKNLASLGIEDYMNDIFQKYSNGLYSFKEIKKEMDYLRNKTNQQGKINFKKFIDGIIFYSTKR